jgi:DNA-binding NarL/FixJ family response regulator
MRAPITEREADLLKAMGRGLCNKEIARELGIAVRTVEGYRERLKLKTGCKSAFQLGVWAVREQHV